MNVIKVAVGGLLLFSQAAHAYVIDQFKCTVEPMNDVTPIHKVVADISVVREKYSTQADSDGNTTEATAGEAHIMFGNNGETGQGTLAISTYFELKRSRGNPPRGLQNICLSGTYAYGQTGQGTGCASVLYSADVREGIPVLNPSLVRPVVMDHLEHSVRLSCEYIRTLNNPR